MKVGKIDSFILSYQFGMMFSPKLSVTKFPKQKESTQAESNEPNM